MLIFRYASDSFEFDTRDSVTLKLEYTDIVFFASLFYLGVARLHLFEVRLHTKPSQQTSHRAEETKFSSSITRKEKTKHTKSNTFLSRQATENLKKSSNKTANYGCDPQLFCNVCKIQNIY